MPRLLSMVGLVALAACGGAGSDAADASASQLADGGEAGAAALHCPVFEANSWTSSGATGYTFTAQVKNSGTAAGRYRFRIQCTYNWRIFWLGAYDIAPGSTQDFSQDVITNPTDCSFAVQLQIATPEGPEPFAKVEDVGVTH